MMNEKDLVLARFADLGKRDALDLRSRSYSMDGTQIIDEEEKIPQWDKNKDYTSYPIGSPVSHEEQVYKLLQPHNAAHYEGNPLTLKALWGLQHTKNPQKAKPFTPWDGSNYYMKDECCLWEGSVKRCKVDNNTFSPSDYPDNWEDVI